MPGYPILISAFGSFISAILIMFFIRRIRHRFRTRRILRELIAQDQYEFIIVDARSPQEFASGHIHGAVNLPLDRIRGNLPTEKMFEPIYVYGHRWRTARKAARILDAVGYFNVTCHGAYRGWNGPVESGIAEAEFPAERKEQA